MPKHANELRAGKPFPEPDGLFSASSSSLLGAVLAPVLDPFWTLLGRLAMFHVKHFGQYQCF